jgi:cbb3-type cytochrome oxidase cytochrome c subunit
VTAGGTCHGTKEWLIGHFEDPPAYVRGSLMPPFKNLADDQLQMLAAFLQNQKGGGH